MNCKKNLLKYHLLLIIAFCACSFFTVNAIKLSKNQATFIGAHTSYLKYPTKFTRAVMYAYNGGYENFYSDA